MTDTFDHLARQVRRRLELEQQFGIEFDPGGAGAKKGSKKKEAPPSNGGGQTPYPDREPGRERDLDRVSGERAGQLAGLEQEMIDCHACPLGATRTNLVFGVGDPEARLVFVGEAPGEDEDLQGIPFVGRAGQLLTRIILNGMKMRREDVYICNIIKCRPPGNRNPSASEIFRCLPFVERQLEIIQPKVICALGAVAAQALLNTDEPIGRLRGRWHDWRGIPMMVTYHTAYLLRTPAAKPKVWGDIKQVMARLAQ